MSAAAKKAKGVSKKTLDYQHQSYMTNVQENAQALEMYEKMLKDIQRTVKEYELKKQEQGLTDDELDLMLSKIDERIEVQSKIQSLKKQHDEVSYLTSTADILFKYYDLVENGGGAGQQSVPTANQSNPNQNSILKWFGAPPQKGVNNANTNTNNNNANVNVNTANTIAHDHSAQKGKHNDKSTKTKTNLLDQYLACTDDLYIRDISQDEECCKFCHSKNISINFNDGHILCSNCHGIEYIIVDHEKPSYRDPPKEITCFAYKRINHLNEWINQIQGKETTDIPDEIYDRIMMEIKKQRVTNMATITQSKIREILKTLGLHKYYEHTPHIVNRLNGQPMPHLSPELEDKLRNMFKQVQVPYVKHMPPGRKNFLSYSYVLHKFLQLLERDDLLVHFPLLLSTSLGARVQEAMPALVACAA